MSRDTVYHGGLMRCCLETLRLHLEERPPEYNPKNGETLACKWCKNDGTPSMIYKDGGWRWNHA